MKLAEAYQVLGIPAGSSEDEAKKAFRKLSKTMHPDVNKAPDAEAKFKQINEAYERIKSGESDNPNPFQGGGFGGFNINDIFSSIGGFGNPFGKQRKQHAKPDITIQETISFRESVLGCTREIKFKRDEKCQPCDGQGGKQMDNGCKKCNGKGIVINQLGNNMFTQSTCPECHGRINQQTCDKCNGQGFSNIDAKFTVNIPPGITPEQHTLNIGHHGHYMGGGMMGDVNSRVLIDIVITPLADLKLVDEDVVGEVSITLLEALEGCVKSVMTIDGMQDTTITAGIRNKDEVVKPNLGLSSRGNHRLIVNVEYPKDVDKLIAALKDEVKETSE